MASAAPLASDQLGKVAFLVGHDDDIVLDPKVVQQLGRAACARTSRWEGMQSDLAIVEAVRADFSQLMVETVSTVDELRATNADVLVIISYKTQTSFAWYADFFDALRELEARGTVVYPTTDFKQLISSKASYIRLLQAASLPLCPTAILERSECVAEDGITLSPSRVDERLSAALESIGLIPSGLSAGGSSAPSMAADNGGSAVGGGNMVGGDGGAPPPPAMAAGAVTPTSRMRPAFHLVTKPSNADGGYGVAFWEVTEHAPRRAPEAMPPDAHAPPSQGHPPRVLTEEWPEENQDVQRATGLSASAELGTNGECAVRSTAPATSLLDAMRLRAMLTAGNDAVALSGPSASFADYLRTVGFVGERPHVLLQPLVPTLAQHFEIKLYFLRRRVFYAALVYGKEQLMCRVVRPATDPALFAYLEPLVEESLRALEQLPPDGPHDPKILMRVDWGVGEPLLPKLTAANGDGGGDDGDDGNGCCDGGDGGGDGTNPEESVEECGRKRGGAGGGGDGFLKRALVKRAASLAAPQKKLKRSMDTHAAAPLTGSARHFINEIEIHPGYYVDWDATPDETIGPLARAYGEYLVQVLAERRAAEPASTARPAASGADAPATKLAHSER